VHAKPRQQAASGTQLPHEHAHADVGMPPSVPPSLRPFVPTSLSSAFTVVELAVVIGIIVLLIALAVPAFNSMSAQSRHASAVQSINGILTRTHIAAVGERAMMAVRFGPAAWDLDQTAEGAADKNRQTAVTYRYVTSVEQPNNPSLVYYDERFVRREESQPVRLPSDVWVAPGEGLVTQNMHGYTNFGADFVLRGNVGEFYLEALDQSGAVNAEFYNADDFLVVFDPHTGLMGGGRPTAYGLRAYDPVNKVESAGNWRGPNANPPWDPEFNRFAFTGLVIYPREQFAALPADADGQERQELLRRIGRAYYVNRHSGVLVTGEQEGP